MKYRQGFTLLEMSIVLLVIGLLLSVILVGRNLLDSSRLLSIAKKLQEYQAAAYSFQEQYGSLPGDLRIATQYWGTATANGDGDNRIEGECGEEGEDLRAWQHLSLAEFIAQNLSGELAAAEPEYVIGLNVPVAVSPLATFYFNFSGGGLDADCSGTPLVANWYNNPGNSLIFAGIPTQGNGNNFNQSFYHPALNRVEARSLEAKIDDENPGQGNLFVINGWNININDPGCVNQSPDSTNAVAFQADLDTEDTVNCALVYWLQ